LIAGGAAHAAGLGEARGRVGEHQPDKAVNILATLAAGGMGSLMTAIGMAVAWPKLKAEARKANAEAGRADAETETIDYDRITSEVARLEKIVRMQGRAIADLRDKMQKLATSNLELELDNRRKAARIAELEAMQIPRSDFMGHPVEGTAAALREAHRIRADIEGLRMRDFLEENLRDVDGANGRPEQQDRPGAKDGGDGDEDQAD
jgi:hypothetical protein